MTNAHAPGATSASLIIEAAAPAVSPAVSPLREAGPNLREVNIPGITGYEVCHELRERFGSSLGVIFLSGTRVEALDRLAGLLIGADDYIVKPFDPDELLARVRAQVRKHEHSARTKGDASVAQLTARERQVLELLARGLDQNQIANELVISPKTVATHIQRVLLKLGVHSRAQAVAVALRERLQEDDVDARAAAPAAVA